MTVMMMMVVMRSDGDGGVEEEYSTDAASCSCDGGHSDVSSD